MKKNWMLASALGVAMLAGGVAIAAPGGWTRDANGDGTVTKAEALAAADARFAKLDANKDGKLDQADRDAARKAFADQRFSMLDADKNGAISRAEFDAGAARMGPRGGADGEGRRGPGGGFHGGHGGHHGPDGAKGRGGMMAKFDTNGDGAISRDESRAAAVARFDAADANRDGQVTAEERQAAHAKMRAEWQAKRAAQKPAN